MPWHANAPPRGGSVGRTYAQMSGVLPAGDMTVEAIVAKAMWALGQTRDPEAVAELFARPVNHDRTDV